MDGNAKVNVLINCFNGEAFLKETIDSVINQSYKNWTIIFWDNQSTDNTKRIIDSYDDQRIKYFYSPRFTQLNEARVMASEKFDAEYIAILDADDVALPDRLQKQVEFLDKNTSYAMVSSHVEFIDDHSKAIKKIILPHDNKIIKKKLYYENLMYHSCVMFRRSALIEVGGYHPSLIYSQDYDLWLKFCKNWAIGVIPEFLTRYRIHSNNLTKNRKMRLISANESVINLRKAGKYIDPTFLDWIKNRILIGKYILKRILIKSELF